MKEKPSMLLIYLKSDPWKAEWDYVKEEEIKENGVYGRLVTAQTVRYGAVTKIRSELQPRFEVLSGQKIKYRLSWKIFDINGIWW